MPRASAHGTQMLAQWTAQLVREARLPIHKATRLLREHGLSMEGLSAPDATLAHDAACALWAQLADDQPSDFGVRFSERFDVRGLGLVGYLAAASPSLGEMLTRVVRFHCLVKRPPTALLTRRQTSFSIVETVPRGARPWPRSLAESILGAYLSIPRRLTGAPIAAQKVRFQHAAPPRPHDVERFFGCAVEYRSHTNELVLPIAAWALPIMSRDPMLLGYLETLAGQRSQQSEIERLRVHIAQSLSAGRAPTLAAAARAIGLGPRTLQRRLIAEHRLTFRGLVDGVRADSAERLLSDGHLTLEEVSYLLGFSDPSALRKARRRWRRGLSPADRSLS